MAHKHRMKWNSVIALAILSLTKLSCTNDILDQAPPTTPGSVEQVNVQITIKTTSPTLPKLFAAEPQNESRIDEMQILVLENEKYKYSVPATNISGNEGTTTFSAKLQTTDKPLKLLFIANSEEALAASQPEIGETEESIKKRVISEYKNKGITTTLPMFGGHNLNKLEPNIAPANIQTKLLRAVARVDVIKDTGVSRFTMKSIQAFRANDKIQVEPDFIADPQNPTVSFPSVPDDAGLNTNTVQIEVEDDASVSQLYLPEAVATDEKNKLLGSTCVIIGGLFDGKLTYYRVDFDSKAEGHPFGQILRNHRYVMIIKRVTAPGWNTPEEAANNASTGIVAEIKSWEESTSEMFFDGSNHFGVSARKVYVKYRAKSESFLEIDTDLTAYTLQWADADGNVQEGSAPATAIGNGKVNVEIIEGGNRIRIVALADNLTDNPVDNYLVIHAGRWKIVVDVIQESHLKYAKTYVNILSVSNIGHLGANAANGVGGASGNGMRGILNANFNPAGTVKIAGFDYTLVTEADVLSNTMAVSPSRLASMDIILFTYNNNPSATTTQWMMDWLNGNPHRVLIVAADAATTNTKLLTALGETGTWSFSVADYGDYKLKTQDANDYFTSTGPFGAVGSDLVFGRYDVIMGRLKGYDEEMQPILTHSVDGGMVLGINKKKRVVYLGDCNLFESRATGNYINNTTGDVSYDRAKLMANLFAWIVEDRVLPGKHVK